MDMAPAIVPDPNPKSDLPTATSSASSNRVNPSTPIRTNPLPLSASQEGQVRDIYYRNVRAKCAAEIKDFALCARSRTITATWLCRPQRLAMNSCMIIHATREEEDRAREEWFNGVEERRKQRETEKIEVERRREEVIRLTKEQEEKERREQEKTAKKGWWGR